MIKNIHLNADVYRRHNKGILIETRQNERGSLNICKNVGDLKEKITKLTCNEELTVARYVRIRSTKKSRLVLHEVEIYGIEDN